MGQNTVIAKIYYIKATPQSELKQILKMLHQVVGGPRTVSLLFKQNWK